MIIIQKKFSDPHNSHEQVMNFVNENMADTGRHKPLYELIRTRAVNPAYKDAMIEADKKHDFEESMSAYLDDLKSNGWNLRQPSSTSSKESATSSVPTEEKESETKSTPAPVSKKTPSSPNSTKRENETSAIKVENENAPNNELVTSEGGNKGNDSNAVKTGLAMAGTAALAAGGFAAYKAWKKRREKKAAIDAEVSGFLNDKYKTDK